MVSLRKTPTWDELHVLHGAVLVLGFICILAAEFLLSTCSNFFMVPLMGIVGWIGMRPGNWNAPRVDREFAVLTIVLHVYVLGFAIYFLAFARTSEPLFLTIGVCTIGFSTFSALRLFKYVNSHLRVLDKGHE